MLKKIGIYSFWEFPEGLAPTTRILAYSKGLVENNVAVEILSFRRVYKDESKDIVKSGIINGAAYAYLHFFNSLGKNYKLFRIFDEIILRIKLAFKIWQSNKKLPFDCFFISFDDNHSFAAYLWIFDFFNIPLVFVADEFPIPIRDYMKDEVPAKMIFNYKHHHKRFAARILMSNSLKKFYDEKIFPAPTFILNTIIDASRFDISLTTVNHSKPYICYMGNLDLRKDNVVNIIDAFYLIESKYSEIELHLYGVPNEEQLSLLLERIDKYKLDTRVIFKGKAKNKDVPNILMNSKILVNSQPITKRAQGGFPTKLGEYLLSAKPAIFTDSGDISLYITDGDQAFIVPPENPAAFAEKIVFILDNYDLATRVGRNGKKFILEKFDAKVQTQQLINFLYDTLQS